MRNIFLFIRRYFNFFVFLFLQVISLYFIIHYSTYHTAAFSNLTNQVTGRINTQYSNVERYFDLRKTNDSLIKANERLYNKLRMNFDLPDSITKTGIDSFQVDSLVKFRQFTYMHARVVANSVTAQNNYIIISKGRKQNFRVGMGIVDPSNAVVGNITDISDDYSVVMSLLHQETKISGKLLKGGETGTLVWDGKMPNIVTLINIPKSAMVAKGDTVITSGFSTFFPKGMLIGTVEAVYAESSSNNFRISLRTLANFYNLEYVYAIDNASQEGVEKLLELKKQ